MTTVGPTPPGAPVPNYWQVGPSNGPETQLLPGLRSRLVALVAAMLVQATIAVLGVLPDLPGMLDTTASTSYAVHPDSFWAQFAVVELIAAVVVSLAFGPVVRLRYVPVIGRLVLGFAFVVVPTIAIVLGAVTAATNAAAATPTEVASGWLATLFFATLFFGLPVLVLAADGRRVRPAGPTA